MKSVVRKLDGRVLTKEYPFQGGSRNFRKGVPPPHANAVGTGGNEGAPKVRKNVKIRVPNKRFHGTKVQLTIRSYAVFTSDQDNDKTTTRQILNLCIPMMPFTPGPATTV